MPENDDLQFFGAVSASVSHELKNVLAVINEQAGLLGDLSGLAARGAPLDPERLAAVADCVTRQVRRGDALLTQFSCFAHTPDTPQRGIGLADVAALAVCLAGRQAGQHRIALQTAPGPDATITADPFLLCRLLDVCLKVALRAPGPDKALRLGPADDAEGPALDISGLAPGTFPDLDETAHALATGLGVRLVLSPGRIRIVWPAA